MNVASLAPYSRVSCPECGVQNRVKKQFGPYQLTRRYAIGGMSSVFIARDEELDREVAVKILSEEYSADEKRIAAFEQEARLTASFSHPNVVRVLTTGRAFGRFYIAMEFVTGGHFEARITERGSIPEEELLPFAIQVAEGLRGAQAAGLIHRDVKPGNILIDSEGNARLVDFGLALVTKGGKAQPKEIWATPYYVPPEAVEGGVEDFRADVYAFGATMYHALAGVPPCNEEMLDTTRLRVAKKEIVPLGQKVDFLTDEVCETIDRSMAYDPEDRYASYEELIEALTLSLGAAKHGGNHEASAEARALERGNLRRQKRRQKKLLWIGLAGGLIALSGLIFVQMRVSEPQEEIGLVAIAGEKKEVERSDRLEGITRRYLAAERILEKGDFQRAFEMYVSLHRDEDVQEPTRTWAGLQAIVTAQISGEVDSARDIGEDVLLHIEENEAVLQIGFLEVVAPILEGLDNLQFYQIEEVGSEGGSEKYIGYMIAGLKNWQQGGIEEGMRFFNLVEEARDAGNGALAWCRARAGDYLTDGKLLRSRAMLEEPEDAETCRALYESLEPIKDSLRTLGRGPFNVTDRQRQLKLLEKSFGE